MSKSRNILVRLTTTAVMIAMSVVLCRLLGFPQTGVYRIEISFLPIAVVAMLYGPIWSGVAYGIADRFLRESTHSSHYARFSSAL